MEAMCHGRQNRTAVAPEGSKAPRLSAECRDGIIGKVRRTSVRPDARDQMLECHRSEIGAYFTIRMKGDCTGNSPVAQSPAETVTAAGLRDQLIFFNFQTRVQIGNGWQRSFDRDGQTKGVIDTSSIDHRYRRSAFCRHSQSAQPCRRPAANDHNPVNGHGRQSALENLRG